MRDPVEKMKQFIDEQKRQARFEYHRSLWAQRLPELLPTIETIVETFRGGLAPEQFSATPVAVLCDPHREPFPLVIAFGQRLGPAEEETGASALFRCEPEGNVHGFRYPFHGVLESLTPEPFIDLGDPGTIQPDEIGNAVVAFLEWAAVGAGCGSARLSFWAPPAPAAPTEPLKLVA